MEFQIIHFSKLLADGRWKSDYFFSNEGDKTEFEHSSIPLGDIIQERGDSIEPQEYPDKDFIYIGLENVESDTGDIVGNVFRKGIEIKSRSKVFGKDDILYGRLRPNLNKVFFSSKEYSEGICSGEFYVIHLNERRVIEPLLLRYILASDYVQSIVSRFQAGAALPRLPKSDFLKIQVPIPPRAVQKKLVSSLLDLETRRTELKREFVSIPQKVRGLLVDCGPLQ